MSPLSLHLGGPAGEAVVVSLVQAAAPPPYQPAPEAPASEWWRNLPPPQLPAAAAPADAWQPQQVVPPGQLTAHYSVVLPQQVAAGRVLTIGREQGNDVVLDDALVSRRHAELHPGGPNQLAVLRDLGSFNGSFVNGHRVQGSVQLAVGAEVIIGNQTFRWDGTQLLASATTHEFTLYADGLTALLPGRQAAAAERVVPAPAVQPDRRHRPVRRRQDDAPERAHRAPAGDARPGDLAGPRPLRALRPAPVPDRPGAAAGHPAPAAQGAPGAAVRGPAPAASGHDPRRSRTTGFSKWQNSSSSPRDSTTGSAPSCRVARRSGCRSRPSC